jgi:hypothetical protein
MRMRQLGKGQSVAFFAPGEVDRRIRDLIPTGPEPEHGIYTICKRGCVRELRHIFGVC